MAGLHTIEGYTYYYKGTRIYCRDITPHPLDYPILPIIFLLPLLSGGVPGLFTFIGISMYTFFIKEPTKKEKYY
jgi:hypothetical protein